MKFLQGKSRYHVIPLHPLLMLLNIINFIVIFVMRWYDNWEFVLRLDLYILLFTKTI